MRAGGDWKKLIDTVYCHDATMRLVKELEGKNCPKMDKVRQFIKETGMSAATYYIYRTAIGKGRSVREIARASADPADRQSARGSGYRRGDPPRRRKKLRKLRMLKKTMKRTSDPYSFRN